MFTTLRGKKEAVRKKKKPFEWTEKCEEAFQQLKKYMASPLVLAKPVEGEPLFLYTSVSQTAVIKVFVREEQGEKAYFLC